MFACTAHRRYLHHACPTCGQPVHRREHGHLPRWWDHTLHPTQCRATLGPPPYHRRTDHPACGTRLTTAPSAVSPTAAVLACQQRILHALDPTGPDVVQVLGQPTTASRYFTDLIQLSYLIRRSWPLARDLDLLADGHPSPARQHPAPRPVSQPRP